MLTISSDYQISMKIHVVDAINVSKLKFNTQRIHLSHGRTILWKTGMSWYYSNIKIL